MKYTLQSKNEQMKRSLLDIIDEIHINEYSEICEEIEAIREYIKKWFITEYEPVNFEVIICKILYEIEKEEERKREFDKQLADCEIFNITKERLKHLSHICMEYGLIDMVENKVVLDDRILFDQFVHERDDCFQAYKKGANVERVLRNCNFKEQDNRETEMRIRKIIEEDQAVKIKQIKMKNRLE